MVGNGVMKLLERAAPEADEETLKKLWEYFREYYDAHCFDTTTPYPGIPELLKKLTDEDIKVAVATNKYQSAARKIIAHCFPDIPFVAVMGQTNIRPPKPDPSVVFAVLSEHPTPKREVMFIGDSAVDMETARRACVDSIGVSWGFRSVLELRKAYADHIVSTPNEIYKLATQKEKI